MAKAKRKKKPARKPTSPGALRSQLERLDRELLKLVNQRAGTAAQLSGVTENDDVGLPVGQEAYLAGMLEQNKGPLADRAVRSVFRELWSGCRALRGVVRVGYLGPPYSYSHLAALERFGDSADLVPVGGIAPVFEEVHRGMVQCGLVPLENSTDGRVADTLEMFTRLPVRICGEVQLRIHHSLLGRCARSEVSEVYSRPQALSQCRNWLAKHLPTVRTVEVTSTSTAAQLAQDKQGAAAIASVQAGVHYGLDALAEGIEDHAANVTRFAVIGAESAPRTGKDKTAVMFEIDHKVGALADATAIFKRNRLNMTWIESFPIPERQGAYLFFVEMLGHERDAKVKKAMAALNRKALRLEVLGSYERAAPLD